MATRGEVPGAFVMVALALLITMWASAFVGAGRGVARPDCPAISVPSTSR